eukprot:3111843-Prymnesium_polylepis.1
MHAIDGGHPPFLPAAPHRARGQPCIAALAAARAHLSERLPPRRRFLPGGDVGGRPRQEVIDQPAVEGHLDAVELVGAAGPPFAPLPL